MNYYGWKPYVPVAARRAKAAKAAAKASKSGAALSPVSASRGAIAKTFWGRAWCENLERYSDYSNRLPRGRTYVRNGSVIDLQIGAGEVRAQVVGSSLYKVTIGVAAVPGTQWQAISAECAASIDTLVELLQGKLSKAVMERICKPGTGLFPAPREIKLDCSCPDWAEMCKHVAAVMYGVGARLDQQPELLFRLRRVDPKELVAQAGTAMPKAGKGPAAGKVLDESRLADVFGIEIDAGVAPKKGVTPRKASAKVKSAVPAKVATPATVGARAKVGAAGKVEAPSGVGARMKAAASVKVGKAVKVGATVKTAASTSKAATANRQLPPAKKTPAKASATKTVMPAKKPRMSRRK
jgi:uncharacterized Zn finger protein